jgi:hypothetical protein
MASSPPNQSLRPTGGRGSRTRSQLIPKAMTSLSSLTRAEEKHRSREEDRLALERGEKTPEDLRRENGLFAFSRVRIDFDGAELLA